jgi:hypothetical protein
MNKARRPTFALHKVVKPGLLPSIAIRHGNDQLLLAWRKDELFVGDVTPSRVVKFIDVEFTCGRDYTGER